VGAVALFHHSPDAQSAPNDLVIVGLDLAIDRDRTQRDAFRIFPQEGCLARLVLRDAD
jgi:hypothetical protein